MRQSTTANNFDALRLLFAGLVFVFHLVVLSGAEVSEQTVDALTLGALVAIQGFFVISGCLVFASFQRAQDIAVYADKRVRRLVPAYAVVVSGAALMAIVFVPAARADLSTVARYLGANLLFMNFLQPTLPGVFAGNPLPEVNGALWTLKVEVMFYLAVPVLAAILRRCRTPRQTAAVLVLIYAAGEAWRIVVTWYAAQGAGGIWPRLPHQLPGQMAFFISGVALIRCREALLARPLTLLAASGAALVLSLQPGFAALRAAGLAGVILWSAWAAPIRVPAARFGDLSYGLYILHFPIIQILVATGLLDPLTWPRAAAVTGLVLATALVMWWTVERPALRRDSHYRLAGN